MVMESVLLVIMNGQVGGVVVECLIFLIFFGIMEGFKIKVVMKGMNSVDCMDMYEICVLVVGDDGEVWKDENGKIVMEFFCFLFNYEYMFIIMIINSDVQIIIIIFCWYDWIEYNDDLQYMGQFLIFNGVMWMDWNFGVISVDMIMVEGWEGVRGYVY